MNSARNAEGVQKSHRKRDKSIGWVGEKIAEGHERRGG